MLREMIVDRKNNRYKETITNPETGEVIHHSDEPPARTQSTPLVMNSV